MCIQQNHLCSQQSHAGVIFCYHAHPISDLHLLPRVTNPTRHWWHISHTAFRQPSVFALTSITKDMSGMTFMRYLLQQRWRGTKRGQPCTSPFPSASFTSTAEPSSPTDPFSPQMPACMKWKPIRLLPQLLLSWSSKRISSRAHFISCMLIVPRNALLVLL